MKYDKIIRAGIPGSGNTYIEQIIKYLLGKGRLISTHVYRTGKGNRGIIIPYRDFRSVMATSMRRANASQNSKNSILNEYRTFFIKHYVAIESYKNNYKYPKNILWLPYVKFFDDIDYLLNKLQKFLEIEISISQKSHILQKFSMEKNRQIADKLKSFRVSDSTSQIHGCHIDTGDPDSWKQFFPEKMQVYVTNLLKTELERWKFKL